MPDARGEIKGGDEAGAVGAGGYWCWFTVSGGDDHGISISMAAMVGRSCGSGVYYLRQY